MKTIALIVVLAVFSIQTCTTRTYQPHPENRLYQSRSSEALFQDGILQRLAPKLAVRMQPRQATCVSDHKYCAGGCIPNTTVCCATTFGGGSCPETFVCTQTGCCPQATPTDCGHGVCAADLATCPNATIGGGGTCLTGTVSCGSCAATTGVASGGVADGCCLDPSFTCCPTNLGGGYCAPGRVCAANATCCPLDAPNFCGGRCRQAECNASSTAFRSLTAFTGPYPTPTHSSNISAILTTSIVTTSTASPTATATSGGLVAPGKPAGANISAHRLTNLLVFILVVAMMAFVW
ncbi:hypothetical protein M427DRAFT_315413 [Gonapodya prolifera JEL478]|uniref:Uncharacterized protein n=1 Tax=Gonapodya prolifera (strain JEL478) TaxID=1344416 RepID=A0A139AX30_GONPJ|nr:hypothetical protein M427DRAFT_315413 [Gonapodya prolifera JEL478]|eukprot:KXS21280.1 hypothetical protein M427DRAFT_315413 [Gonapodya prolifera JEL478]